MNANYKLELYFQTRKVIALDYEIKGRTVSEDCLSKYSLKFVNTHRIILHAFFTLHSSFDSYSIFK